jgi:hypothetical protein
VLLPVKYFVEQVMVLGGHNELKVGEEFLLTSFGTVETGLLSVQKLSQYFNRELYDFWGDCQLNFWKE